MLPSKGFFSGIPCVFFTDDGCSRSHCHYRHSYQDVVSGNAAPQIQNPTPLKSPSNPTRSSSEQADLGVPFNCWSPAQVNLVTKLVEKAVDKALKNDSTKIPQMPKDTLVKNTLDKLFSDPEALKMASGQRLHRYGEPVPSYKPTPISKLPTKHIPVLCVPEKPYSSLIRTRPQGACSYSSKNVIQNRNQCAPSEPRLAQNPNEHDLKVNAYDSGTFQDHFPPLPDTGSTALGKSYELSTAPNFYTGIGSKINSVENFYNNETKFIDDHRHSIQLKNVTIPCRIPLKRLAGLDFQKKHSLNTTCESASSTENSKHEKKPLKKKLKLSYSDFLSENLDSNQITETNVSTLHPKAADHDHLPRVLPSSTQLPKPGESVADHADEPAMNDKPVDELKNQFVFEPPVKKKRSESISLQVSSSADPFIRWMKNKKIQQILGKDKKHKDSSKKPTFPGSVLLQAEKKLCSSKPEKVRLEEELPEPKIAKRVAHKQEQSRPLPISTEEVKIPSGFRNLFCVVFFEEFKKTLNVDDAKKKAVEEELKLAKNSRTVKTYKNNCSLLIMKLRKGEVEEAKVKREDFTPASCPHFTYGWSLYQAFLSYVLCDKELRDNGFPLAMPDKPNCAFVDKSSRRYSVQQPEKPFHKICAHCSVEFQVDGNGMPTTMDDCFHHWGKLRRIQYKGQTLDRFTCCGGSVDSSPCEFSTYHVWSGRNEDCMEDFVETRKLPSYMEDHEAGIYALDCEMCYTTKGLELARLTVLDLNGHAIFDQVISLQNPILNYCTRFSGIDAAKMASATYTFEDVRRWILDHFYDKTILVGHSLENDLKVLKLIHRTIVDTSVTFPHKYGPPNKMSLKHLANVVLEMNIQENVDGHDSKEDAATCLKLMMKKILEDSKARKPRVIIGYHGKKK